MVKRWTILLLLLSATIGAETNQSEALPSPPSFVHKVNEPIVYFTLGEYSPSASDKPILERTLRCAAEGNPAPNYLWKKDGQLLDLDSIQDRVIVGPDDGKLFFKSFLVEDEGNYTCEASNSLGVALSENIRLEHAWIKYFAEETPEKVEVELGDPYIRKCTPPESNPKPHLYWIVKDTQSPFQSLDGDHISMTDDGTLFFHAVKETDQRDDVYYTCAAENTVLKDYKFGNHFQISVNTDNHRFLHRTLKPPMELYSGQSAPIALQGQTHKLSCFFGGIRTGVPKWYHNGTLITIDNSTFTVKGKQTLIFEASMDKAGEYACVYQDAYPNNNRAFTVIVEAAPYWLEGPPTNTQAKKGETVSFDCGAGGVPAPSTVFYKNASPLVESQEAEIRGSKLILHNVTQESVAVYQCKVENKHGILWTNFYLNIVAPIAEVPVSSEEEGRVNGPIRTGRVTQAVIIFTIITIAMIVTLIIIYATRKGGTYKVAAMELERWLEKDSLL